MKTRKQLKREIAKLKDRLQTEERVGKYLSGFVSENNLPKCESIACAACRKAIIYEDYYRQFTVLGCGKDLACADYDPIIQPFAERYEAMQKNSTRRI